ncbi:MAG: nucleotidyltransferase domain-containing protein [Anaerolineae bacterium]|jgi:predicted nucleotidyltransferase
MKAVKHRLNEDMKTRLMTGELAEFCQERGISLIVLFGSQVRGSAKEGSDVDLGLVLDTYPIKPEEELTLIRELVWTTENANLDITILNHADPLLGYHVACHGCPIYEREPHSFNRFQLRAWKRFIDTARFRRLQRPFIEAFLRGDVRRARQDRHRAEVDISGSVP